MLKIGTAFQKFMRDVESTVRKKPLAAAPLDPVFEALRIHLPPPIASIVVDYSKFTPAQQSRRNAQAKALGVLAAQRPVEGADYTAKQTLQRTRSLCEFVIFLSEMDDMAPSDATALERIAESLGTPQTVSSLHEIGKSVLKQFPPKSIPPTFEGLQVCYMAYKVAWSVSNREDLTDLFFQLCERQATECGGRMQHQRIYAPEPLNGVDQIQWARVQQAAVNLRSLLRECSEDGFVDAKYGTQRLSANDQLRPDFMLSLGVELHPVDARQLTPLEVARVRANVDDQDWTWLPGLKDAVHAAVAALDAASDHAG